MFDIMQDNIITGLLKTTDKAGFNILLLASGSFF